MDKPVFRGETERGRCLGSQDAIGGPKFFLEILVLVGGASCLLLLAGQTCKPTLWLIIGYTSKSTLHFVIPSSSFFGGGYIQFWP